MIDDGQGELLPITHTPFRKPRDGTPGERIYLRLWQQLNDRNPDLLRTILNADKVSQREATVAAYNAAAIKALPTPKPLSRRQQIKATKLHRRQNR